jgi:cytoskeletal protein RodZ
VSEVALDRAGSDEQGLGDLAVSTYAVAVQKVCNAVIDQFLMTPSELWCRFHRNEVRSVNSRGEIRQQQSTNKFKGHQVTKRLGILIAVIAALVAGGLALGFGLMSNSHATTIKPPPAAQTTTSTTTPPPPTTPPTAVAPPPPTTTPPTTVPPPPPTTVPPVAQAPAVVNGIPQGNGGDQDADNNGGPSDGDGNL